jgi:hypothetical protein
VGDALRPGSLRVRPRVVNLGQALDLLDVEHRVALHERNLALDIVAITVVLGLGDSVCVHHQRALLAFADVRIQLEGLLEGHPNRGGESVLDCRAPQHQDVDAGIGLAVVAQGASNPAGGVFGAPGFRPGTHALFE